MAQRIKGQEVEIVTMVDGAPRENFNLCKSVDFTHQTEILQEGYIGETTDRFDTIFKGVRGKLDFHFDSPEPFNIIRIIVDKARRRNAGTRVNIKATLNFPSGKRARVIFRDVEFGNLPINFGDRSAYGSFSLDFACSDAQALVL